MNRKPIYLLLSSNNIDSDIGCTACPDLATAQAYMRDMVSETDYDGSAETEIYDTSASLFFTATIDYYYWSIIPMPEVVPEVGREREETLIKAEVPKPIPVPKAVFKPAMDAVFYKQAKGENSVPGYGAGNFWEGILDIVRTDRYEGVEVVPGIQVFRQFYGTINACCYPKGWETVGYIHATKKKNVSSNRENGDLFCMHWCNGQKIYIVYGAKAYFARKQGSGARSIFSWEFASETGCVPESEKLKEHIACITADTTVVNASALEKLYDMLAFNSDGCAIPMPDEVLGLFAS